MVTLPPHLLWRFIKAAELEIGRDELVQILSRAGFSSPVLDQDAVDRLDQELAADQYAGFQAAIRAYYGRGSRGILLRIGRSIWEQMLLDASLREKAELTILRSLPVPARRRRLLQFVADHLFSGGGSITVHMLDTDLLLVDRIGASVGRQRAGTPICFVTVGFLEAALLWATGQGVDIEEISCRAVGDPACEFRIRLGAKLS